MHYSAAQKTQNSATVELKLPLHCELLYHGPYSISRVQFDFIWALAAMSSFLAGRLVWATSWVHQITTSSSEWFHTTKALFQSLSASSKYNSFRIWIDNNEYYSLNKPLLNWRPSLSSESHKRLSTCIGIVILRYCENGECLNGFYINDANYTIDGWMFERLSNQWC